MRLMVSDSDNQAISCYQDLIVQLQTGAIKPGDYLREQVIAESLGMSRTPVREALRKLMKFGKSTSERSPE